MENERILSYMKSKKLSEEDIKNISAAGSSNSGSAEVTNRSHDGWDTDGDLTIDI